MRQSMVTVGTIIGVIGFALFSFRAHGDIFLYVGLSWIIIGVAAGVVGERSVEIVCSDCKQKAWVIYLSKPDPSRPIYCALCYQARRDTGELEPDAIRAHK
jgi:CxxC-x17-CxxC domain-containing protein